jgi:D-glycerate 3-kinase
VKDTTLDEFLREHRLPVAFRASARDHYLPLAGRLPEWRRGAAPLLLGVSGAQGTGKTTLAEFLALAAGEACGWHVAVLSIDDFYLTKSEREALGRRVHPLLVTRGVPGTHDVELLARTLDRLEVLRHGERLALPRFSKSDDDRSEPSAWPAVSGPLDLIILEGWCVGSVAPGADESAEPINALERDEDEDGRWRSWVDARLARDYAPLFERLDALVFLAAPSFEAVYRWRLEQEQKLAGVATGAGVMSAAELRRFIQHYERITRRNLATLPARAAAVLWLNEAHEVVETCYRRGC